MEATTHELEYLDLKVAYSTKYSTKLAGIVVYIKGLPVAIGVLQFLELVAVMEGFLANQLPPRKERYRIAIKNKIPYLGFYVKKYDREVFLDKADVRVYLKILKQFERMVYILDEGIKTVDVV